MDTDSNGTAQPFGISATVLAESHEAYGTAATAMPICVANMQHVHMLHNMFCTRTGKRYRGSHGIKHTIDGGSSTALTNAKSCAAADTLPRTSPCRSGDIHAAEICAINDEFMTTSLSQAAARASLDANTTNCLSPTDPTGMHAHAAPMHTCMCAHKYAHKHTRTQA